MSFLEKLPYEICVETLSYLPHSDLANASRLSRHMHALSEPLLYKAPVITDFADDSLSTIEMLLRTILSPGGARLATLVHSLHITCSFAAMQYTDSDYNSGEDDENVDSESAREAQSDLVIRAAAAAALEIHGFRDTLEEQVKMLLHHVPCLNTLNIVAGVNNAALSRDGLINHNLDWLLENLPRGIPLRHFSASGGGLNLHTLLTLLSLPSIRKIDCGLSDNSTIDFDTLNVAPATSLVTDLRFSYTTVSQEGLEFILNIPAALKYFSYCANNAHHTLDLSHALAPLRMSLTHLHLEYIPTTKPIGPFRDWPLLRTVRSSLTALLGKHGPKDMPRLIDVLPAGLRELEIHRNQHWSVKAEVNAAVDLLEQKATRVPELKTLVVVISPANMTRDVREQGRLRIACCDAGVTLAPAVAPSGRRAIGRLSCRVLNRRR